MGSNVFLRYIETELASELTSVLTSAKYLLILFNLQLFFLVGGTVQTSAAPADFYFVARSC